MRFQLLKLFAFRVAAALGQFLLLYSLARHLGADGVGLFVAGQGIAIALGLLSHLGLNSAIVKVASTAPGSAPVRRLLFLSVATAFLVATALACVTLIVGLIWPGETRIATLLSDTRLFLLAVPALTSCYVMSGFFKAARWPTTAIMVEPAFAAMVAALGIEAAFALLPTDGAGTRIAALVFVGASWLVLGLAAAQFLAWRRGTAGGDAAKPGTEVPPGFRAYLRMSTSFLAISITEMVQNGVMVFVAAMLLLDHEVGLFRTAERLTILIGFLLIVINAVLPPLIVQGHAENNLGRLEATVRRYAAMTLFFGLAVAAPLVLLPETVLSIFGKDFAAAAPTLQILTIGQLVTAAAGSSLMILKMTSHLDLARNISVVSSILFLGGFYVLTDQFRLFGAALAVTIWLTSQHLLATILVHRKLGIMVLPFLPAATRSRAAAGETT